MFLSTYQVGPGKLGTSTHRRPKVRAHSQQSCCSACPGSGRRRVEQRDPRPSPKGR